MSKLPVWVFVLVGILGFNEFVAIITNPVLSTLVAIITGVCYILHKLNLLSPIMGHASTVMNTVAELLSTPVGKSVMVTRSSRWRIGRKVCSCFVVLLGSGHFTAQIHY